MALDASDLRAGEARGATARFERMLQSVGQTLRLEDFSLMSEIVDGRLKTELNFEKQIAQQSLVLSLGMVIPLPRCGARISISSSNRSSFADMVVESLIGQTSQRFGQNDDWLVFVSLWQVETPGEETALVSSFCQADRPPEVAINRLKNGICTALGITDSLLAACVSIDEVAGLLSLAIDRRKMSELKR